MRRAPRFFLPMALVVLAVAATAWLLVSVIDMHDRLAKHSGTLALVFVVVSGLTAIVSALAAARFFWRIGHVERAPAQPPEDVVQAAEVQAERAEGVIVQVKDESARLDLQRELATLRADRQARRFHVVVFGTGSAGKTSLINALIGQEVGKTGAVMGTTRHGETHSQTLEGVDGTVILTDTPGLSEIGAGGADREREARDLAARADLLIFVVDHDLIRSEHACPAPSSNTTTKMTP